MLPRYVPKIGWDAWRDWLVPRQRDAEDSWRPFLETLGGPELPPFHYAFDRLRNGLVAYFSSLRRRVEGGHMLVSAQICGAVPLAIRQAGFAVRYVDIDEVSPTPSAEQFAAAVDETTVGALVAPLYGHIQREWNPLLAALDRRILVLDLAQGIGLEKSVVTLVRRADVVAYSFGLGKGLDVGGGLLLSRNRVPLPDYPMRRKIVMISPLLRALVLRALLRTASYGAVIPHFDSMDSSDPRLPRSVALAPPDIHRLWRARLPDFLDEIERARHRARVLAAVRPLAERLRDTPVYFSDQASHLRQVIRVRDAARRDELVARLRMADVDCAPAGEPLPATANAASDFPNAHAFRRDAVRLPFLGRLNDAEFYRFRTALEQTVVQHLS